MLRAGFTERSDRTRTVIVTKMAVISVDAFFQIIRILPVPEHILVIVGFKKDPVKTIKEKLGINISDDQIQAVIAGVTAKLGLDKAGGILGKIKGLFGK